MTSISPTVSPAPAPPRGAVSNPVYDVLTMLQSKLEALAAYEQYLPDFADDAPGRHLVEQLRADDARHAQRLRDEIERRCRAGTFR